MSRRLRWLTDCADCGGEGWHSARGLCELCYWRHRREDTLADWPRLSYSRDELLEEWALLSREGHTRQQAADRLGISKERLDKAIQRDRKRTLEGAA